MCEENVPRIGFNVLQDGAGEGGLWQGKQRDHVRGS